MEKFERVIVIGDPNWVDDIYKKYYKAYFISKDLDEDIGYTTLFVQHDTSGQHNQKESISKLSNFRINQGKIKLYTISSFLIENFVNGNTADVYIKTGNKDFGYSSIWLSGGAETIPWRTQNYRDCFSKEEILREDFETEFVSNYKNYISDSDSQLDAFNEMLDFWVTYNNKEERLSIANTKEDALRILESTSDEFVIVFSK